MDIQALSEIGMQGFFFILLFAFVLHAVFVTYHWFSYGTSKSTSLFALALYLTGAAVLLLTMSVAQSI